MGIADKGVEAALTYVFFNNDIGGYAVKNAAALKKMLGQACGTPEPGKGTVPC